MMVVFTLSMPNVGSWDGKWSGEGRLYAIVKSIRDKATLARIFCGREDASFYYNFGDGWGASVRARAASAPDAAKIRRKSKGFCGYDWMVDSILRNGEILNSIQQKEKEAVHGA